MIVLILTKQKPTEYETSRLVDSFSAKGIKTIVANPNKFDIIVDKDIRQGIKYEGQTIELPDLVLLRQGAGISNFQLAVIRHFEQIGIPCVNSSVSVDVVKDKLRSSQILSREGIAIPSTMLVRHPVDDKLVSSNIGFPCVIKVVTGSYGEGIHFCESKREFKRTMEFIETLDNKKTLVVQEYMGERPGEDLRVLVIGGKVLGVMKRTAPEGDFRANITRGGTGESFPTSPEIEETAIKTAKVLGLEIAGIDLLFDTHGFRVCEANSNPGFSGFEKYCHTDVADNITDYIINKLSNRS